MDKIKFEQYNAGTISEDDEELLLSYLDKNPVKQMIVEGMRTMEVEKGVFGGEECERQAKNKVHSITGAKRMLLLVSAAVAILVLGGALLLNKIPRFNSLNVLVAEASATAQNPQLRIPAIGKQEEAGPKQFSKKQKVPIKQSDHSTKPQAEKEILMAKAKVNQGEIDLWEEELEDVATSRSQGRGIIEVMSIIRKQENVIFKIRYAKTVSKEDYTTLYLDVYRVDDMQKAVVDEGEFKTIGIGANELIYTTRLPLGKIYYWKVINDNGVLAIGKLK